MPRLPDAQIAYGPRQQGGGNESPMAGPLNTLASLMQIKEQQSAFQARRQAEEDDYAIRSTMQQHDRPDEAIEDLYRQGRVSAAGGLAKHIYDARKSQMDAADQELKTTASKMEMATQIAQGMTDEQSFQNGRKAIVSLLQPIFGDGINDQLGTNYDETRMKAVRAYGTKRTDELKRQQDAIGNANKAIELQQGDLTTAAAWQKNVRDAKEFWNTALSRQLSLATNQGQWDAALKQAHEYGAPEDVLTRYGPWDPDGSSPKKAAQLSIDPKERETIAHNKEQDRLAGIRAGYEGRRVSEYEERGDAIGASGGAGKPPRGISDTRESEVIQRFNDKMDKLEEQIASRAKSRPGSPSGGPMTADEIGIARLRYENQKRDELKQPSIEREAREAEAQSDTEKLDEIRKLYKNLRGVDLPAGPPASRPAAAPKTPGERRKLAADLLNKKNNEKDPKKRAAIQKDIDALAVPR